MPHRHRDRLGNPDDHEEYLRRLEGEDRAEWQKPDEVIAALALPGDAVVADIGAGPGYFSLRLAAKVAHVFAVEAQPRMLEILRERLAASAARNVTPVLAMQEDPLLARASCDRAIIINTFHHFPDGVAYLRTLSRALRPGGRIVDIDFVAGELPMGPPPEEKVSREQLIEMAAAAGLRVAAEHRFLEWQYFLELAAR